MNEFPPLPTAQLKLVVTDPEELSKGLAVADKGGLKHFARHGNKLLHFDVASVTLMNGSVHTAMTQLTPAPTLAT